MTYCRNGCRRTSASGVVIGALFAFLFPSEWHAVLDGHIVSVDGQPTRSCTLPIGTAKNHKITTIEGMENDRVGRVVQDAWTELGVAQCGYCQAGQIMSAVALLKQNTRPTDKQIDTAMNGNICRCGTYPRIRAAIQLAARRLQGAA